MNLTQIKSRDELPCILPVDGIGVELGVAKGVYSEIILQNSKLKTLYSVDRWSDHHNEEEYINTRIRLSPYGDRSIIMRETFADAVLKFPDGFFDFIYIDGYAHTGQLNGQTLYEWYPKLKPGGVFAGHDYSPTWQPTIDAVDLFCNKYDKKLVVIGSGVDNAPSWVLI